MKLKNPFGMDKNNNLIHASELDATQKGEKCGCYCPECHDQLIAKIGNIKVKHFAHKTNAECSFSAESGMHLYAKELLRENLKLMLPKVMATYKEKNKLIANCKNLSFSQNDIQTEKAIDSIRPDIIIIKNGKKIVVEIKVTHGIDETKLKKIVNMELATIEIDLSDFFDGHLEFNRDEIKNIIIDEADYHKSWIYNKKISDETNKLKIEYEELQEKKRREEIEKYNYPLNMQIPEEETFEKILNENHFLLRQEDSYFYKSDLWGMANKYTKIDYEKLPSYLNYIIDGEMVFACDRRIWQTLIYTSFLNDFQSRDLKNALYIRDVINWLKMHQMKDLLFDKLFVDNMVYFGEDEVPILTYVLSEFFLNLCRYGCTELYDFDESKTRLIRYYWKFRKITSKIKYLDPKYLSNQNIEIGTYLVNKENGDIVGNLKDLYI